MSVTTKKKETRLYALQRCFESFLSRQSICIFIIWLTDFACCDWSIPGP